MTYKIYISLLLLLIGTTLVAQTPIPGGTISNGHWTAAGSPYRINGNQVIENLIIDPGVIVQFTGNYKFEINGVLQAEGFYSDSIYFQSHPDNTAGWKGMNFKSGAPLSSIAYCRIEDANDQGIKIDAGNVEIVHCRITHNIDDGFQLKNASIELKNCDISDNAVDGIVLDGGQITLRNSIVSANGTTGFNSMDNADQITLINSIVADNQTSGIDCPNGIVSIKNSIVYNNTIQIISDTENTTVTYSNIEGIEIYPGTENINSNPDFTDSGNYSLSEFSPCVDAGDSIATDNDLYFPPSLGASRNDIGAYGGPDASGWYPPLYIIPRSVQFDGVRRDSSETLLVEVRNYRNTGITATEIFFEDNESDVFGADRENFYLPYRQNIPLSIIFTPDEVVLFSSNLIIQTSLHGEVSIPVQGEGIKPDIDLLATEIEFELVPVGELSTLALPIRNSGKDTLTVNLTLPLNSAFSIDQTRLIILPDSTIDTCFVSFMPDSVKSYEDYLIILNNDPDNPSLAVPLSGEGLGPVIDVDRDLLEFGSLPLLADSSLTVFVSNHGNDTLRIDSLILDQAETEHTVFTLIDSSITYQNTVAPDSHYVISVRFNPQNPDLYSRQLHIYSNDPLISDYIIDLTGTGIGPEMVKSPAHLDFGNIYIDEDSSQTFTIKNTGNDTLSIDSLFLSRTDSIFYLEDTPAGIPFTIDPDDSLNISVWFSPREPGAASAKIFIFSNDPFNRKDSVALSGTGISEDKLPIIELSTSSFDFGNIYTDQDSVQTFTIKSIGNDTLSIDSLYISQSDNAFTLEDIPLVLPYNIKPSDSTLISVRFMPKKTGIFSGNIFIVSNDPFNRKDSVALSGTGISEDKLPKIELSTASLDFGNIYISEDSVQFFRIKNTGNDTLSIVSLLLSQSDNAFTLTETPSPLPYNIIPNDSTLISVRFMPKKTGIFSGNIFIASNDPFNRKDSVIVSGRGLSSDKIPEIEVSVTAMDFGQIPLNSDSAQTIYIHNLGSANLIVDLRISGEDSLHFRIENIDNDTLILPFDSLGLALLFDPQKTGPLQSRLMIVNNDPVDSLIYISLSGIAYDSKPALISFDPLNSTDPFIDGQAALISFLISDVSSVDSALLFVRQGGKKKYEKMPLYLKNGSNSWWTQIDAELITPRGIEYYVRVEHGWRSTTYPQHGMDNPNAISVLVPDLHLLKTKQKNYQMISVPFNTSGQDLNDLFSDNLGSYNNSRFRIFDCLNGSDYTEISTMSDSLPPGKALWLITKEATELDIANVNSVPTDHHFPLQLKKGWNMIATPFPFPIDWGQISNHLLPWYFEGTEWQPVSTLEPFFGYAVKASVDTLLMIPPIDAISVPGKAVLSLFSAAAEWQIQLIAESGDFRDQYNFAGVMISGTSDIDRYDYHEPPPIGDNTSVYFLCSEMDEHFATDYRKPGDQGYTFTFELNSNIAGKKSIRLLPYNLPTDIEWAVVSDETGINHDKGPIQTNKNKTRYNLLVGTSDYINQMINEYQTAPTEFKLTQNYPNPFNPYTSIRYQLPRTQHVSIKIYNILGQLVKTLVDNELKETGYYQIQWDGSSTIGHKVASGIYLLVLQTEEYNRAIKMVLQK